MCTSHLLATTTVLPSVLWLIAMLPDGAVDATSLAVMDEQVDLMKLFNMISEAQAAGLQTPSMCSYSLMLWPPLS